MKRNIACTLLAIVMLFLSNNIYADACGERQVVSRDAVKSKIPCPGEDFSEFLAKFENDEAIQREFTMYPLIKLVLDYDAIPEPEVFISHLNRDQIQFPVFPSPKERAVSSRDIELEHLSDNDASVRVFQPDTGWTEQYLFRKDDCWRLRRIEDWSM